MLSIPQRSDSQKSLLILCCVLGQDTLLWQYLSPPRYITNVRSFPYGKHCFQCQFLFSRWKLCLRYTAGNFNKKPSMRAPAKFLRERASEHLQNFCEQFEQRLNFSSTFELDRTIRHPLYKWVLCKKPVDWLLTMATVTAETKPCIFPHIPVLPSNVAAV